MSKLVNLKAELKQRTRFPTDRPFVCDGSPLDCTIFIVGLNPATPMDLDFWSFWPGDKFEKENWRKAYESARRKTQPSRTRRRLDEIAEAFPRKCLETNLYWTPTKSEPELRCLKRQFGLNKNNLYFLLEAVRPRVVVGHGACVREEANVIKRMGIRFVQADRHLSRISDKSMKKLIGETGDALKP